MTLPSLVLNNLTEMSIATDTVLPGAGYLSATTDCVCVQCGVRLATNTTTGRCDYMLGGSTPCLTCGDSRAESVCAPNELLVGVERIERDPRASCLSNFAIVGRCCRTNVVLG